MVAAPAGLSQQHQQLKEPLELTKRKFLNAYLSSKVSIAQETLRKIGKDSANTMVCMVAMVAGWFLLGSSCTIRAPC